MMMACLSRGGRNVERGRREERLEKEKIEIARKWGSTVVNHGLFSRSSNAGDSRRQPAAAKPPLYIHTPALAPRMPVVIEDVGKSRP